MLLGVETDSWLSSSPSHTKHSERERNELGCAHRLYLPILIDSTIVS